MSNIWHPERFQGGLRRRGYFEGWYCKTVTRDRGQAFAFIFGVSLSRRAADSHSFIQVLDGTGARSSYFRFDVGDFGAERDRFEVRIGDSLLHEAGLTLDINRDGEHIGGELTFGPLRPWPVTLLSPGAMGPFRFLPAMECYHGIASMDHELHGRIDVAGETVDFVGGRGYMEKDWGQSMPKYWVWMQSNNFETLGTSLSVSVANIPFLGTAFDGFIIGILHEDAFYRFSTYTGAKLVRHEIADNTVELAVCDRRHELCIRAERRAGAALASPLSGAMSGRINESLDSRVEVGLTDRRTGSVLFEGAGTNAGLEIVTRHRSTERDD